MSDKKQTVTREQALKQAMEFWGVPDIRDMDPMIGLLPKIFAHESNKLHQEIDQSDSRIPHRLSRILIGNKWSLPKPVHALMTITPNHGECCKFGTEDYFYAERNIFGRGDVQVFIASLFSYKLVDVRVKTIAYNDSIRHSTDSFSIPTRFLDPKNRVADYYVQVRLDVSEGVLQEVDPVVFCIRPSDVGLLPFMNTAFFYDCAGNRLNTRAGLHVEDPYGNAHYLDEIRDFYSDLYFNVSIKDASKEKRTYREVFPGYVADCEVLDDSENLFWIKIVFPEIPTKESLENLKVYLNTFPIVNRQIVYKQHSFHSTGRIIPLKYPGRTQFLNIRSFQDNKGRECVNRLNQYEENPTGIFSLYFGDLERFGSDSARSLISKVLQLMKEGGSALASMNPDALSTRLKGLFNKINGIEKGLEATLKGSNKIKAFILSVPQKDAANAEIKYWVTSGSLASGFNERTLIQQFNIEEYDASGIMLHTCMQGKTTHDNEQGLINSLKYGLLSRGRVISEEDIRSYLLHKLGKRVESVEVDNDVAISSDSEKGLIGVAEVEIRFGQFDEDEIPDLEELARYLEKDLTGHSICSSNYKIKFV